MIPNLNVVICGILLSVVVLAATGAGIITPETYKRIGETSQAGPPMTQRLATNEAARVPFSAAVAPHRSEEIVLPSEGGAAGAAEAVTAPALRTSEWTAGEPARADSTVTEPPAVPNSAGLAGEPSLAAPSSGGRADDGATAPSALAGNKVPVLPPAPPTAKGATPNASSANAIPVDVASADAGPAGTLPVAAASAASSAKSDSAAGGAGAPASEPASHDPDETAAVAEERHGDADFPPVLPRARARLKRPHPAAKSVAAPHRVLLRHVRGRGPAPPATDQTGSATGLFGQENFSSTSPHP